MPVEISYATFHDNGAMRSGATDLKCMYPLDIRGKSSIKGPSNQSQENLNTPEGKYSRIIQRHPVSPPPQSFVVPDSHEGVNACLGSKVHSILSEVKGR
jgi:hypothetical protein